VVSDSTRNDNESYKMKRSKTTKVIITNSSIFAKLNNNDCETFQLSFPPKSNNRLGSAASSFPKGPNWRFHMQKSVEIYQNLVHHVARRRNRTIVNMFRVSG
jgi:hypothetical protein